MNHYMPGDILHEEECFVRAISKRSWGKVCGFCLRVGGFFKELKFCSKCRLMKYCSKDCQKKAWPNHKLECPILHRLDKKGTCGYASYVNLIGNCIMKLKDKPWNSFQVNVIGRNISLEDVQCGYTSEKGEVNEALIKQQMFTEIESYVGKENMPSEEILQKLRSKVAMNMSWTNNSIAIEFYIGSSCFEISCVPNVTRVNKNGRLSMKAINKIHKKTQKLCISRLEDSIQVSPEKEKENRFKTGGCSCSDCSQPYGTSPLTKVLNIPRSDSVIHETVDLLNAYGLLEKWSVPVPDQFLPRVESLLKRQKGVLGETNILRMRLKYLYCLLSKDDAKNKIVLLQLAESIKSVYGENSYNLLIIGRQLLNALTGTEEFLLVADWTDELMRLQKIHDADTRDRAEHIEETNKIASLLGFQIELV